MKQKTFFNGCNTYNEMLDRAAEVLVYETRAELGYREFNSREAWTGFTDAFKTIFDSDELYARVEEIEAKVTEAGGIDKYTWSWEK